MDALEQEHVLRAVEIYHREGFDAINAFFKFDRPVGVRKLYFDDKGPFAYRVLIALAFYIQDPVQPKLMPANFYGVEERNELVRLHGFHVR